MTIILRYNAVALCERVGRWLGWQAGQGAGP